MKILVRDSDVPAGWSAAKLKYHAELNPKCETQVSKDAEVTFTPMENVKNGYFIPRTEKYGRFVGNSQYSEYEEGDIAFAKVTPCFENNNIAIMQSLVNGKGFGSSELFVMRPLSIELKYLFYLLQSPHFKANGVVSMTGTGGLKRVSSDAVRNYKFALPSAKIQNLIASYLDAKCAEIDKVVEQTRATIEEYKKLKQAIITEAVTKGLDSSVPMKDSGVEYLGCIPRGWSIISIGQAFVYVGGFAFKSELFTITESNYQVLRIGNVKNNNLILDNKQIYIDESCAETAKVAEVRTDDILFTMTGTKGKRDYFYTVRIEDGHIAEKRLFINQRVGLFRKKNKKIKMAFANYLLKEKRILDYIFLSETGTANQGNLGIETIARTKLYLPPLEEQEEICLYLDVKCAEIDRIIEKKEQLIEELGSYKKSLIYEYVTGKKEIEIHKYS